MHSLKKNSTFSFLSFKFLARVISLERLPISNYFSAVKHSYHRATNIQTYINARHSVQH
jgi:hypothetical protein